MRNIVVNLYPLDRLDREHTLMNRLVDHGTTGPDVDPRQHVVTLFSALSQTRSLIASREYGEAIHVHLRTVLVAGAALVRRFGVPLYEADEWPDSEHTRIGGDGALATGHHPLDLMAEVWEAATWVATFVQYRARMASSPAATMADTGPTWLAAEPVTELMARTWCLADSLDAREPLRDLIREHLSADPEAGPSLSD